MINLRRQFFVLLVCTAWSTPGFTSTQAGSSVTACFGSIHQPLVMIEPCERALTELGEDPANAESVAVVKSALAMQFARKGQLPTSRVLMEEAILSSPQNLNVLVNLGSLNMYEGDFDAALVAYDRALTMQADPHIYLNRSLALRALGRYAEAQDDYYNYVTLVRANFEQSPVEGVLEQDAPVTVPIDGTGTRPDNPSTRPLSRPALDATPRASSVPVEDRSAP